MRCWCGYLSGARHRLFAYGPADATIIPKPYYHFSSIKSKLVLLFWYPLIQIVLEKRPLSECSSKRQCLCSSHCTVVVLSLVLYSRWHYTFQTRTTCRWICRSLSAQCRIVECRSWRRRWRAMCRLGAMACSICRSSSRLRTAKTQLHRRPSMVGCCRLHCSDVVLDRITRGDFTFPLKLKENVCLKPN